MADESVDAKSCAKYNVSNHPNECEILLTKNRIKYLQETINSIDTLPRNHEIIIDPKTSTWELICEYHIPYPSLSIKILHIRFSMYSIHFISQNNPFACRMIVGPQWWLMASTLLTLATLSTAVFISTFNRASTQELITGLLLCLTCLISYALVGCFDPGIVERYTEPKTEEDTFCQECDSYRPESAFHCEECRVCIKGHDHHCPWTGKCIGEGNITFFYVWLFSLVVACVYEIIQISNYMLPP
ncbi:unnamed protein product [Albugo candida]|uniref:Palmitoyltransferase n=1 Tax=Albugo candida TaxID=65357 RepID=A0A024GLT8_9STRA|nr:unnamed protein product [Albugo candida]|eukprot:CCI47701.1 unnamed protein product [Albugo candida]